MQSPSEEFGIISAFIEKLEHQAIPRALAIKKRIVDGDSLNEIDSLYLEEQIAEASSIMHLLEHHPEYQDLVGELASLYNEISELALTNEMKTEASKPKSGF